MLKCKGCKNEDIRLACLICEQKADREMIHIKPEIISVVKRQYDLTLTEKVVWATVTAGLITKVTLGQMLHKHPATIWRIYRRANEKLKEGV